MSPFTRYGGGFSTGSPFGVSPFASARDLPLSHLHDPWRGLQRTVPGFPPSVSLPPTLPGLGPPAPWTLKPDPILEQREREEREREQRERERLRREREERERREREEKQRRLEQQVFTYLLDCKTRNISMVNVCSSNSRNASANVARKRDASTNGGNWSASESENA